MLDPLDFDDHLVRTSFQHAVIVAAHRMAKIYRTAKGGSPEAGGLVQVCGLVVEVPLKEDSGLFMVPVEIKRYHIRFCSR